MISMDGKAELQMLSFQAPKIRLLRSMSIETEVMQVSFSIMFIYLLTLILQIIKYITNYQIVNNHFSLQFF